jgi:hypothetical protein
LPIYADHFLETAVLQAGLTVNRTGRNLFPYAYEFDIQMFFLSCNGLPEYPLSHVWMTPGSIPGGSKQVADVQDGTKGL